VFSTAEDNQPAVTIQVAQGEREFVRDNKVLGQFNLDGIAPARRGLPQIEVTFDIDANGILKVSATDKNTGKEQNITIKGSSGLSDSEIDQMIKDAEANADKDKKAREVVDARNGAEGSLASVEADFDDVKDDMTPEEVEAFETAATGLREACKGDDKDAITSKLEALQNAAQPVYAAKQRKENPQTEGGAETADEDVVDAEFTDVSEEDTK
jgi:molecular chaperone DnaK